MIRVHGTCRRNSKQIYFSFSKRILWGDLEVNFILFLLVPIGLLMNWKTDNFLRGLE